MKHALMIIILALGLMPCGFSQDFKTIDSATYRMYEQGKWQGLVDYYHENVNTEKVDYYYLRMRAGIAYYSMENYLRAIPHFQKAVAFNSSSQTAREYLYYSYLFSGQNHMADKTAKQISVEKKEEMGYDYPSFFESLRVETGLNFSNGPDQASQIDLDGQNDIYGEEAFTGNTSYSQIGITHQLSTGLSVYHAYSNFQISKDHQFVSQGEKANFDYGVKQNNYYVSPSYTLGNGLRLTGAYHYIHVGYDLPVYNTSGQGRPYRQNAIEIKDYLLHLSAGKFFDNLHLELSGSYSELNDLNQQKYGAKLSWFPYGNYKFVTGISLEYFLQNASEPNSPDKGEELIAKPFAIWSLSDDFWLKGSYTFGELYNYSEEHGFIVYNIPDKITRKAELTLNYRITPTVKIDINYRYMERKDEYLSYNSTNQEDYSLTNYNFENHYIIGGITWDF